MKEYYWDKPNQTKLGKYLTSVETAFIDGFLKQHKIKRCLEIGCGSGRLTIPIWNRGIDITGSDIDKIPLAILKKNALGIKTLCHDASKKFPFSNSSFDSIIAIELADYLDDLTGFFRECRRLLKDNGFLIFTHANKTSYKSLFHRILSVDKLFYRLSFKEIKNKLEENNFSIQIIYGYNWIPVKRDSNNIFVPILAHFEHHLNLGSIPALSPWLFFIVKKEKL